MFQKQLRKQFTGTRLQPSGILLVPGALSSPAQQEGEGEMMDAGWCGHDKEAQEWGGKGRNSDVGQLRAPRAPAVP